MKNRLLSQLLRTGDIQLTHEIAPMIQIPRNYLEAIVLDDYITFFSQEFKSPRDLDLKALHLKWLEAHDSNWPSLLVHRAILTKKIESVRLVLSLSKQSETLKTIDSIRIATYPKLNANELHSLALITAEYRERMLEY